MKSVDAICDDFQKQLEILNRNPEDHEYGNKFALLKEEFNRKVMLVVIQLDSVLWKHGS